MIKPSLKCSNFLKPTKISIAKTAKLLIIYLWREDISFISVKINIPKSKTGFQAMALVASTRGPPKALGRPEYLQRSLSLGSRTPNK